MHMRPAYCSESQDISTLTLCCCNQPGMIPRSERHEVRFLSIITDSLSVQAPQSIFGKDYVRHINGTLQTSTHESPGDGIGPQPRQGSKEKALREMPVGVSYGLTSISNGDRRQHRLTETKLVTLYHQLHTWNTTCNMNLKHQLPASGQMERMPCT
jgi:hypothetical protein